MNNNNNEMEIATLANGCFWCSEAIFKKIKGVKYILPGYTGGTPKNPSYDQVCTGMTGHAESIQIKFDPKVISFEKILNIFWHTHDPTTLNRQGNDVGTQYRSAIFYHNEKQKKILKKKIFTKSQLLQKLLHLRIFMLRKIITKITMKIIKMIHIAILLLIPNYTNCF